MRLVQFALPDGDREAVLDALDAEGVDYVLLGGEAETVVQFPLPAQAVEDVLGELREAGLDDRYVVVTAAESAVTEHFDELESRFVAGSESDESIDPTELAATARDMTPNAATYYSMTLLSALVAVAGLLLDSPALVVGSMVIAPQVGSALTTAVGVVRADREMVWTGVRAQVGSLLVAVLGAATVGWLLQAAAFVPATLDVTTVTQISQRISPGALSLAVGLAAGAAGALGLATALPVSLVGVMVAAALIPAAATVGVGVAWNLPVVAAGAALLLASNFAAINVAAPAALLLLGYRPSDWGGRGPPRLRAGRRRGRRARGGVRGRDWSDRRPDGLRAGRQPRGDGRPRRGRVRVADARRRAHDRPGGRRRLRRHRRRAAAGRHRVPVARRAPPRRGGRPHRPAGAGDGAVRRASTCAP
ncbi:DUF389 domain-containing protein [Halobacterium yunchengense]|uniref:DUF389 domain-containing protein n=1 Tax=Halobacterium yunchengense TaxID=3108497 RepID=UPI00300940BB